MHTLSVLLFSRVVAIYPYVVRPLWVVVRQVAGDVKRILPEPRLKPEELYPAGMSGAMADLESAMEETLGDLYKEKLASQADAAAAAEKSKLTAAGSGAAGAFGAGGVGGGGGEAGAAGAIDMAHFYGKGR